MALFTRLQRKAFRAESARHNRTLCPPCVPTFMAYHPTHYRDPPYWCCTRCHRRFDASVLAENTAEAAAAYSNTLEAPHAR